MRSLLVAFTLLISPAALACTSSATPSNATALSTYTYSDRSCQIPNNTSVASIGTYSQASGSGFVKILKRTASGTYDVVVNQAFNHPGGGWADATVSYSVPATGDYFAAGYFASATGCNTSTLRAVKAGDVTGNGSGWTDDTSCTMALRVNAGTSGGGASACGIVLAGQSLSANFNGPTPYTIRNTAALKSLDYATGVIAAAVDPLPGPDGDGGTSFASPLGDMILDGHPGRCSSVVIANVSKGGSSAAQWAQGGTYNTRITAALDHLTAGGVLHTAFIWRQGQEDAENNVTRAAHIASLLSMIATVRSVSPNIPIFVWRDRWANGLGTAYREITAAQAAVVNPSLGIYEGPDGDSRGCEYRRAGCVHENVQGYMGSARDMMTVLDLYFATN